MVHINWKHDGVGRPVREDDLAGQSYRSADSVMNEPNKKAHSNPYAECDRIQKITDELVELKTTLSKHLPKDDVEQIISLCCTDALHSENKTVLKGFLNSGRRWVRFREKLAALEQGMPNEAVSAMLKLAFIRANNNITQMCSPTSSFSADNPFGSHNAYVPEDSTRQGVHQYRMTNWEASFFRNKAHLSSPQALK
jgi:hypothetical protein